ncbi:hypothetical protein BN863_3900 [Formosa agariphila KMM 3901]|uniref:Lipoprotein n=1 Tax=Formosa agariphila (strain DSM 15362 / KCTC 12365 / LMG 23005 / KMM 3901 / M-2Alg 35-1) TaxID=1347342 RepID=T2KGZ9_FORAG|nr:hypothetical protein [Formosa agariphila]CDF78102.1 hypothetical protein BN863_3900 [Formosa agariphila KMM 3901]
MKKIVSISCLALAFTLFNCGSTTSSTSDYNVPPPNVTVNNAPTSNTVTTTTTVEANSTDISDNLDLEAVASVFGESKDLEDFEKRLNNPDTQISNLDLNEDGNVDYLRVVSVDKGDEKIVTIQSVLAKDEYQDVATIDVKKENNSVQVIGDQDIYGPDYYLYPTFVATPLIMDWFWGPYFSPWFSPFYWGYYPPYFRPWRPFPPHIYHNNIHGHINHNNHYHHNNYNHHNSDHVNHQLKRNDHFSNNGKTFQTRNPGSYNKHTLDMNRGWIFYPFKFWRILEGFHGGGGFHGWF